MTADIDPRVERSRRVICEATLNELADVGYGAMSIESIAKRAGVGKATIYRHWRGKLDLVESALDALKDEWVVPTDCSARQQVTSILQSLIEFLTVSPAARCLPAIVSAAQYDDGFREFHRRFSNTRRSILTASVVSGIESGEFARHLDPELTTDLLVGPIFYRKLMTDRSVADIDVDALVSAVLFQSPSSPTG